eukprot:2525307-Pyramimonas_sp.AAC.1
MGLGPCPRHAGKGTGRLSTRAQGAEAGGRGSALPTVPQFSRRDWSGFRADRIRREAPEDCGL